jgi:hypothetical protein
MSERRAATSTGIIAEVVAAIATVGNQWCWHPHTSAPRQPTNVGSGRRYGGVNVIALRIADAASDTQDSWRVHSRWRSVSAHISQGDCD